MKLKFDYGRLRERIKEKFGSCAKLSREAGISKKTLSLKLNNRGFFTQNEITKLLFLLDVDLVWAKEYFFTLKIQ